MLNNTKLTDHITFCVGNSLSVTSVMVTMTLFENTVKIVFFKNLNLFLFKIIFLCF
jgi:hypothetical protein